jgi:hypothetical protein
MKAVEKPLVLTEVVAEGTVIFGKKVKVTKIWKVQDIFRLENVSINEG